MINSKMFSYLGFLVVNFIAIVLASERTAVVNTTSGPVQGQIFTTIVNSVEYAAFTGIRYGKAPVGYLRFKPPVPVDPWTETLDATEPGSECPQIDSTTNSFIGSEDCLFLSVYTTVTNLTETPKELKAVMVWIYGGSFLTGSQANPNYRPDYLLDKDIVFVPVNYRLGALGFLSLNHPNATGNAGLKDQALALKWVQANIEKFGGNPKNVTIFGQSAGAVSVGYHVLSEVSAGLFHGAISMSGAPLIPWGFTPPSVAEARAKRLAMFIGEYSFNKDKILKALYAASAEELVHYAPSISPITPFTPTLEDESITTDVFISECIINKYNTGNFSKVPQLLGFMQQEAVSFLGYLDLFSGAIDEAIKVFPLPILNEVKKLLNSSLIADLEDLVNHLGYEALELAINETTNLVFKAQIDITQRLLAAKNDGKPVYYYDTTFTTNDSLHNFVGNNTIVGAGHADDLAYIFYVPYAHYSHNLSDPTALTIYRVSTMWTNFAKYGNPTPDWIEENYLDVTWPESGCNGIALDIGYNLTVESRPIGLSTEVIEAANYLILSGDNTCKSHTSTPKCHRNVYNSLLSIDVPIFDGVPNVTSLGLEAF